MLGFGKIAQLDVDKFNRIKKIGMVASLVLVFILGLGLGHIGKSPKTTDQETTTSKKVKEAAFPSDLSKDQIEDFLIAYFTKKDLGENRARYETFMSEAMYKQEVATEEEPVNQTYKGYVVDFKYKSSEIYINQDKLTALVKVTYTSTYLAKKNDYTNSQKNVPSNLTLKVTYLKQGNKLLVNNLTTVVLTDTNNLESSSYSSYIFSKQTE
ncbi:hypothetical protein K6V78_09775 [Streptococcus gallolyticus]|nr:hypothetical protein [Streptococcus gallolyticus]MBY5041786.1 hypothetical protein [Streptococcus gallolyticus]